jgi:SnoaL-like protein
MTSILEDKDAIRELMAQYCFHFDNGEFEDWLQLFTTDGAFDLGVRGRFAGRDSLRQFLKVIPLTNGLPMMRHCVMNSIVRVDGERATARSYVVVVQGGDVPGISVAGRYEDRLVKVAGTWQFIERKVHFDLMAKRQ